ncbi:MAG: FMN-binding protein [Chromatiales bacterium]
MNRFVVCVLLVAIGWDDALARGGVYQEPDAFIAEAFAAQPPAPQRLTISEPLADEIRDILGRDLGVTRLRYWQKDGRTAWILEEIGKEEPITTGIVVSGGRIERVKVLIFRESRGWEVRYPFFTDQFNGAQLSEGGKLDRSIDGISGATLSVNALRKLARLALLLDKHVQTASGQ